MDQKSQSCENCRFWKTTEDSFGECMRYPPEIVSMPESVFQGTLEERREVSGNLEEANQTTFDYFIMDASRYPLTEESQWCGEWSER